MKSSPPVVSTGMPPVLWALMFGNFVIATGVMIVPGTLNDLSSSLAVSIPVAGQLIAVSGVVMCLCAPLFASAVATWDRRRLLALCMLWYGVLQLLSAVMPTFGSLLVVRALTVISPAIFTPQVAACMAFLVPAHQRGKAISLVFLGWSVASVLGVPLGAWIGGALGWRYAFAGVGLLSLASAAWVWRAMPRHIRPPAFSLASWRETLQSKPLMLCIGVTALYSSGQFVLFAYLAPYYKVMFDITPYQLSMMFGLFGLFGFIGNVWVSRHIDRLGPQRVVGLSICSMALSFLLWSLGSTLLLCALVLVPWALGCFAANSAQQARISGMAPALASGAISLNTSAIYAGQAIGAATGGWLIGQGQMGILHWVGLAGLLMSWWVSRAATRALGLRSLKS